MSTACEAVGLVRDGGLDDGAGVHVAQGKAELQAAGSIILTNNNILMQTF